MMSWENHFWSRSFGQFPMEFMDNIRNGDFVADRDYTALKEVLKRWRLPNGLFCGIAQADFWYQGAMAECLGIIGPMSEMLLQSWEGVIRVFPIPPHISPEQPDHTIASPRRMTNRVAHEMVRPVDRKCIDNRLASKASANLRL